MENEADNYMTLARILLNLGHSYLHTVDIDNSEEESGETESGETEGEETESEGKKCKASEQLNIEEEEEVDHYDKQHNDKVIKQQKLEKKLKLEDIPQQFYRETQQKSYNNLSVEVDTEKQELEKEVANKSNDKVHKLNIDLPKEFNNTIQQKLECGVELIGEVQEEFSKKQEKLHTDDQPKMDKDKEHECNEELIIDSEKEEKEISVQLLIEVPPMPGKEVELYLELRVDSECQQELDIKNQEVLVEKQQNIDKEHQKPFDKNMKHTDPKDIQAINENVQVQFDEINISPNIERDIQDKINEGSKQNMEEENTQSKLNESFQEQYNNEDYEETQTNIHEETMDENHKRILQEIESLICYFQNKKKIENKKKKNNLNEEEEECDESVAIRIAKITKEVEELEINMEQEYDEELEREYNDEFNSMFSSVVEDKFLEELLISFNEDAAPYYKRIDNLLKKYFPTKLDTIKDKISIDPLHSKFNDDLRERSDVNNDEIEEIQEESGKRIEEAEEESDAETYFFKIIPEQSDIEMREFEDEVVQSVLETDEEDELVQSLLETEDEDEEESDVDVEGLSNPDIEVTGGLDWNLQIESEINADESDREPLQVSDEEIEELNEDVNIVTEIVYDYEVEEEPSNSAEELNSIEESVSTDNEFSSTEIKQCNEEIQQKINKEEQVKYIGSIHELQKDVQDKSDSDKPQKFEDLQLHMEIENIQDLDEIPLKLKIQQEQLEEKLHQQMKTFQEEFYKNSKLEYDKEQQLKGNTLNDPVYDRQQKLFYELKDKFLKTKEEYKDLVQQKMIEALQQKVDEKQLLEMKEFPEEFVEPNIEIEDLHKEVLQLQRECTELEPEFSYNIPLVVDEKPSKKKTKKVKYDLYEKLFEIHKKKLCFFADSKEWPEKYLYPSSLLDELFDDPSEVSPNFFVITLYSVDIGYSVKITMNEDTPPVETFYSYTEDSVLEFVEREQLPPCLLDLFDKARPRLFYNGCVIVEIHDKCYSDPMRVYRILLHPHKLSIQSDVNRIIARCKPVHCSYTQRLKIESKLLRLNFPVMCMDSSPVAGLTVQLQHQLLSRRTITLNPLKMERDDSSKFEMDLSKQSEDDSSPTTKLHKSHKSSSDLMEDTTSDNIIHHLIWKFEFRINTFKLIKLYVFVITETLEYSMLLCMNSTVPLSKKMRFKVDLETNKLKPYIDVILEILKQNVNPDVLVVRRYKSDDKSVPMSFTSLPSLLNDNVYEPSSPDIHKFLDELLENIPKYQCDQPKTDETKRWLKVNKKVESKKKDINSGSSKRLSRNPEINMDQKRKKIVQVESKKSVPHKVESSPANNIFVDSKSLKSSALPIDFSSELKPLQKKSLYTAKPSVPRQKSKDAPIHFAFEEFDSMPTKEISPTVSSTETDMSFGLGNNIIFSFADSNTNNRIASGQLEIHECGSIDINSKPVVQLKTDHTKCLEENDFSLKTSFDNITSQQPLYDFERAKHKSELSSCDDKIEENIKVIRHIHRHGICLRGPETIINKAEYSLVADITEGRFSNASNNAAYQQEISQLDDDLTTDIDRFSNLQVDAVSFQEINYTPSTNTEDIKSVKRKRSS